LAGARLIIFPPAIIPGCPDWVWSIAPDEDPLRDEVYAAIRIQVVPIPSAVTDRLCRVAQRAGVAVVIGLVERADAAEATNVYSALLSIDAHGEILGRYRAPTIAPPPAWTQVVAAASAERARTPATQAVRDVGGI
jgi:predicted amidohydrolase